MRSAPTCVPEIAGVVQVISELGGPIQYQTEAPAGMGGWDATIAAAIRYHATAVELWPDARFKGFMSLPVEAVAALGGQMAKTRIAR